MAQNNNVTLLKVGLVILAIVSIIYGLGFLIIPGMWVSLSGGDPVQFGWLRWSGGIIIALGIGALQVFRRPEKQGIFVFMSALSTLLAGLGILFSWIMKEYSGSTMFVAVPTILLLIISGLLWWGRQKAKGIL
jgi:O-antigen/teichoic acid export membrane protein